MDTREGSPLKKNGSETEEGPRKRNSKACDVSWSLEVDLTDRHVRHDARNVKVLAIAQEPKAAKPVDPTIYLACSRQSRENGTTDQQLVMSFLIDRGPPKGFKRDEATKIPRLDRSPSIPPGSGSRDQHKQPAAGPSCPPMSSTRHESNLRSGSSPPSRHDLIHGLPSNTVDHYLAVYFTHVHNVWPLIYKPSFNPRTTSAPLLLSMLAVAACIANPPPQEGIDQHVLYRMAEKALERTKMESRLDLIQTMILLSLRQTGAGDKRSAYIYAGRASCMALDAGLNLASRKVGPEYNAENEARSRVYWSCYIMDKVLAEETSRPFFLPYRRSSVPFPSINETDELETWPPPPISSSPIPASVRHLVPRRGYVMSCFVWTCRMGIMAEAILDLEAEGPALDDAEIWDRDLKGLLDSRNSLESRVEDLTRRIDLWRKTLPAYLDVQMDSLSPLPHHVISITWYHTCKMLLHSRFLRKRTHLPLSNQDPAYRLNSHTICTQAAEAVVDQIANLDKHQLLQTVISDIIHILSLATLFEAYDSTSSDPALAHRAKLNFAQCCLWLRETSSSWPKASQHRVFFEGLIQGGLKLSAPDDDLHGQPTPHPLLATFLSDGFRGNQDQAPDTTPPKDSTAGLNGLVDPTISSTDSMSALFQMPQYYWNHLTTLGAMEPTAQTGQWDLGLDTTHTATRPVLDTSINTTLSSPYPNRPEAWTPASYSQTDQIPNLDQNSNMWNPQQAAINGNQGLQTGNGNTDDPDGLYAALLNYMVNAAGQSDK